MARYKIFYPGLNESLRHWRRQVIDSLPYVAREFPRFNSLKDIFDYCKKDFKYVNEPPLEELFQTVPTMLENNVHGISGAGDCDDGSILVTAPMLLSGFDCGIVLAGRTKDKATHIYTYGVEDGQRKILDLTTNKFNKEGGSGDYKYRQYIPFKISKNQLDMFLTLADGKFGSQIPTIRRKKVNPMKKIRIRNLSPVEQAKGVYLPSSQVTIPLDRMDKMPIPSAKNVMLNDGCSLDDVSEYLSGRKERKQKRAEKRAFKKEKKDIKLEKKRAKVAKKEAKTEKIQAKAQKKRDAGEAKKMRAQAKILKGEAKKIKGANPRDNSGYLDIVKGAGNFAKTFINREAIPDAEVVDPEMEQEEYSQEDYSGGENYNTEETEPEFVESEEMEMEEELQDGPINYKHAGIGLGLLFAGLLLERSKIA